MIKISVVAVWLMIVDSTFITRINPDSPKLLNDKPSSNNTPQSEYYVHRRGITNFNMTEKPIIAELDHLIECLKSFVTEESFDEVGFAQSSDLLREEVLYCGWRVSRIVPMTWEFLSRFKFVHKLYSEMKIAIEYYKFYSHKNIAHDLVRRIIGLNIGIFALYGPYGLPDPTINDYAEKSFYLKLSLRVLEIKFRNYTNVSLSVSIMFEDKYAKAREALIEAERCGKFFAASVDEDD